MNFSEIDKSEQSLILTSDLLYSSHVSSICEFSLYTLGLPSNSHFTWLTIM